MLIALQYYQEQRTDQRLKLVVFQIHLLVIHRWQYYKVNFIFRYNIYWTFIIAQSYILSPVCHESLLLHVILAETFAVAVADPAAGENKPGLNSF